MQDQLARGADLIMNPNSCLHASESRVHGTGFQCMHESGFSTWQDEDHIGRVPRMHALHAYLAHICPHLLPHMHVLARPHVRCVESVVGAMHLALRFGQQHVV